MIALGEAWDNNSLLSSLLADSNISELKRDETHYMAVKMFTHYSVIVI